MFELASPVITPKTQSIKYIGSKLKLLPHIISLISDLQIKTIFDGFSGTTRVSQALARLGYKIVSNDISEWSHALGKCYLMNKEEPTYYKELISYLNSVKGYSGWFTENYGGYDYNGSAVQENGRKGLWQVHNTRKLDAIRDEIDRLDLSDTERSVALISLIIAMDEVDNTIGHFSAYLSRWSSRSYKKMKMKLPNLYKNQLEHKVLKEDVFTAIKKVQTDLCYFDPPYGSNNEKMPPSRVRYASYYHIWTSIIRNDKPKVFGEARRREDTSDTIAYSVFEDFRKNDNGKFIAVEAIGKLIEEAQAKYIILSYSSGGRATSKELNNVLNKNGKILKLCKVNYQKNVMANMSWTNEWIKDSNERNMEYLFLMKKY